MKTIYQLLQKFISITGKIKWLKKLLHPIYLLLGLDKKRKALRNKVYLEKAPILIKQFKLAMQECNVPFWLEFGTLLGVYRENSFLKHDLDIDVGVLASNYSGEVLNTLEKHGFKLVKEYLIDEGKTGREQTYEYENVSIDIFYFYDNGENLKCHCFIPFDELKENESIEKYGGLRALEQYLPKLSLKNIDFLGSQYAIPEKTKEHLAYHYGEDFMIPNPNWNYKDIENDNVNAKFLEDKLGIQRTF